MPKRFDMKSRGSITIFMILSLSIAMSLFFSMSEVVRYFCMKIEADELSASAAQSGLGDYNRLLYEKYGILAVDMGYGKSDADDEKFVERVGAYLSEGGNPGCEDNIITHVNLSRMDYIDPYLSEVTLLTDYGGAAFMKEAAIQEVYDIPKSTLKKWQEAGEAAKGLSASLIFKDVSTDDFSVAEHRVTSVTKGESSHRSNKKRHNDEYADDEAQSLIDAVDEFKKSGVLAQVMPSGASISVGYIDTSNAVSKRALDRGSGDEKHLSASEQLLYKLYLIDNMSSYTDAREREALTYELEYVICGKRSDEENLRATVKRLLALREAENITYLLTDSVKRHEAWAMGTAASAAIANPELAPFFAAAILGAWGYLESVLDVRLLLYGGRVPLIKDATSWNTTLSLLPTYFDTNVRARDVGSGIDYKGYMFALLCTLSQKNIGLRPLDVMEAELHASEDYHDVMMDNMMVEAKYNVTMTGTPLFISLAPLVSFDLSSYEFKQEKLLSYL